MKQLLRDLPKEPKCATCGHSYSLHGSADGCTATYIPNAHNAREWDFCRCKAFTAPSTRPHG